MLHWIEGFDLYNSATNIGMKWITTTITASSLVPGRNGGQALQFNDTSILTQNFVPQSTWTVGFAFQPQGVTSLTNILNIRDNSNPQIKLNWDPVARVFSVLKDATILGTGTYQLTQGFWYYIELQVTINNSTGSVFLHVNTVADISLTGINTQSVNSTVLTANNIEFRAGTGAYLLDDMYICDSTGSYNTTFLGDMTVETLVPNGPGANAQWTPNPVGTLNFQDVIQGNGDASFVQASTNSLTDTYAFNQLFRITGNIAGIAVDVQCRKTDSGVRNVATVVRDGGTNYVGTPQPIPDTSYEYLFQIYETDPGTAIPWTVSNVNSDNYGIQSS